MGLIFMSSCDQRADQLAQDTQTMRRKPDMPNQHMPNQPKVTPGSIVVFDLDGTLVDTAPDLIGTLNKVIATEGLPPIPNEQVGHLVGQGALKMLDKAYLYYDKILDEELRAQLLKDFLEIYVDHLADESRPFEGVLEALSLIHI